MSSSNDLCEELIVEIFSRLPTKSLLRFRSVSKSLRARIGSPDFIRLHTLRSPNKLTILHLVHYYNGEEAESKVMYTIHSEEQLSSYAGITPVDFPFGGIRQTVGSCNGILCVYDGEMGAIHLWNPSIRSKTTVRDLPPSDPCLAHGFGFDPIINDYKILRTSNTGTFVYTMKTRTWREIASHATPFTFVDSSECLFNGALYWVVGVHLDDEFFSHHYILTFDLSSEVFSTIELPEPNWETNELTIIKGCLAVISLECFSFDYTWIWVWNTAAASWSDSKLNSYAQTTYGNILFSHFNKGIKVYNPETKARSRLGLLTDYSSILNMITFIESLELLDMESC